MSTVPRSAAADLFWNEIGNVKDDLKFATSLSGDIDVKTGSFLQRYNRELLVRIHSLAAAYLREIVHQILKIRPLHKLLPDAAITYTVDEIMSCARLEELQRDASSEVFRKLENKFKNRSGTDLVGQIVRVLNEKKLPDWTLLRPHVQPFFALRHLIVHNGGRFDQDFVDNFGKEPNWKTWSVGDAIPGKIDLVRKTIRAFGNVVKFIDPVLLAAESQKSMSTAGSRSAI